MLDVCLLGNGGTQPLPNRWLTALITSCNGKMLLIDCGEGTQIALKSLGWGLKAIDIICFTHYHGDHIAGLPGLLLSMGKSGREEPLLIIGPQGLTEVVQGLTVIAPHLPFELKLLEVDLDDHKTFNIAGYIIQTIYVDHTVPCMSYALEIKRARKFDLQKAKELDIPCQYWSRLQKGEEIRLHGAIITSDMVLGEERKGIKLCYCTDTRPTKGLEQFIKDADLLICEGMYAEDEKLYKAEKNKHMLFSEAASLAKLGEVREVWLTHFSPSLVNPRNYLTHASDIFNNIKIGECGMRKTLTYVNN